MPRPPVEVFAFFSDPKNLARITPAYWHLRILHISSPKMKLGTTIDNRMRRYGVPLRWRSEITGYDPPHCFIDEQRQGPFRFWLHEHRFSAKEGGTEIEDLVTYRVPGGRWVNRLFVRRDLEKVFRYRQEAIQKIFGAPDS